MRLPPVVGHRGAAGYAPENTLAGFRVAARLGISWVEIDVQLSADKVPVVFHDHRLDRTTDAVGLVRRLPLDRLKRLDAGGWFDPAFAGETIPTLAEALDGIAALGLGVNIELKPPPGFGAETAGLALAAAAAVWPPTAPPPLVSSFDRAAMAVAREHYPDWPRGLLVGALPRNWRAAAAAFDCVSVHCRDWRLKQSHVAAIRAEGLAVLVYTVNDPDRARQLWGWGVDALFTDVPASLLPAAAKQNWPKDG